MSRLPFAPPVEEIQVDVERARMEFSTRPGTQLDAEVLREAVRDAGFDIGSISLDGEPLEQMPPQSDP